MSAYGTSGRSEMFASLSAFGAKRTWRGRRWRIDWSLMTPKRTRSDRDPAVQQRPHPTFVVWVLLGEAQHACPINSSANTGIGRDFDESPGYFAILDGSPGPLIPVEKNFSQWAGVWNEEFFTMGWSLE